LFAALALPTRLSNYTSESVIPYSLKVEENL